MKPLSEAIPMYSRCWSPWLQGRDQALQAMSAFLWRFKTMFPGSTLDVGGMTPAAARALATIAPHQVNPLSLAAQELHPGLQLH